MRSSVAACPFVVHGVVVGVVWGVRVLVRESQISGGGTVNICEGRVVCRVEYRTAAVCRAIGIALRQLDGGQRGFPGYFGISEFGTLVSINLFLRGPVGGWQSWAWFIERGWHGPPPRPFPAQLGLYVQEEVSRPGRSSASASRRRGLILREWVDGRHLGVGGRCVFGAVFIFLCVCNLLFAEALLRRWSVFSKVSCGGCSVRQWVLGICSGGCCSRRVSVL